MRKLKLEKEEEEINFSWYLKAVHFLVPRTFKAPIQNYLMINLFLSLLIIVVNWIWYIHALTSCIRIWSKLKTCHANLHFTFINNWNTFSHVNEHFEKAKWTTPNLHEVHSLFVYLYRLSWSVNLYISYDYIIKQFFSRHYKCVKQQQDPFNFIVHVK